MVRKILFATIAALVGFVPASARFNGAKKDAPKAHVGIRAGVGASIYGNLDHPLALTTGVGGLYVDFKVAQVPVYVETGAYYMDMGTRLREDYRWYNYQVYGYYDNRNYDRSYYRDGHYYSSGRDRWDDAPRYTIHNHSVLVPLAVSYHLYLGEKVVLQPFTGVYGSYGFTSKDMDFGLRDGIAVSFDHFNISVGVNVGLIDQKQQTDKVWIEDAQHTSLFFALGFNF